MSPEPTPYTPDDVYRTPSGLWCGADDFLRVSVLGAVTTPVIVTGRFRRTDDVIVPISMRIVGPNSRTAPATGFSKLDCGWLETLSVVTESALAAFSPLFVTIDMVRGQSGNGGVLATLFQDYVSSLNRGGWPHDTLRKSTEGPGFLRSIAGTDPAANVEVSETVPTGARWKLRTFRVVLVTDANVANRIVDLIIDDGTTPVFQISAVVLQAASVTFGYTAAAIGVAPTNSDNQILIPVPPDLLLLPGWRIRTATLNRQVTDNFGAPQYQVEEWLEGA